MDDNPAESLYIGLMSGTSMDGIDAALVRLGDRSCTTLATYSHDYPAPVRQALITASQHPESVVADDVGRLDHKVGECFRNAALELIALSGAQAAEIRAIGSHGQTLRHLPRDAVPFTLQIGDPNIIATGTGITTVADFRRRDLALGGEGAPLAPAFHQWLFADESTSRAVLNIGGIANVTVLRRDPDAVLGFDTGPGNTLMDAWIRKHSNLPYDADGAWAASGKVDQSLLSGMLKDPYFAQSPPKSTGFEYFNLNWLDAKLDGRDLPPEDVQATLLELTVQNIAAALACHAPDTEEVFVCGGGISNAALMHALASRLAPAQVQSTARLGLDPNWVEAAAFAWLASRTIAALPGNLPPVTGARKREILGAIYLCADREDSARVSLTIP